MIAALAWIIPRIVDTSVPIKSAHTDEIQILGIKLDGKSSNYKSSRLRLLLGKQVFNFSAGLRGTHQTWFEKAFVVLLLCG